MKKPKSSYTINILREREVCTKPCKPKVHILVAYPQVRGYWQLVEVKEKRMKIKAGVSK